MTTGHKRSLAFQRKIAATDDASLIACSSVLPGRNDQHDGCRAQGKGVGPAALATTGAERVRRRLAINFRFQSLFSFKDLLIMPLQLLRAPAHHAMRNGV